MSKPSIANAGLTMDQLRVRPNLVQPTLSSPQHIDPGLGPAGLSASDLGSGFAGAELANAPAAQAPASAAENSGGSPPCCQANSLESTPWLAELSKALAPLLARYQATVVVSPQRTDAGVPFLARTLVLDSKANGPALDVSIKSLTGMD